MKNEDTFKNLHLYEDEETIQKTLRYLEIHDPENATRDYAIGFLKFMQRFAHVASKSESFDFEGFLEKYKKQDGNF
ncbi:hypothetical protein GWK75_01740 [Candidatus Saccharibacteria bacterium oral taxon 955]|jgi:hypothetical protein|nr:hypothetical protein GWK75_01740 [Candidatus Saccharibacteria bacterium oral taxon 955]